MKLQTTQTSFTSLLRTHTRFLCSLAPLAAAFLLLAAVPAQAKPFLSFDFDSGTPTLTANTGLPVSQTVSGMTAVFSGNYFLDTYNPAWGIAGFSGLYLQPNDQNNQLLTIDFSQPLISLAFTYAATDQNELPVQIVMTAYQDTTFVGSSTTTATVNNGFEFGTATLAGQPSSFNKVTIETVQETGRPGAFLADDFRFEPDTSAPEPATWSLIGLGLASVGIVSRRKRAEKI
jgi:hypothetical protein